MLSSRKSLFFACCLALLMFGVSMTILGALLPTLMDSFQIDKANAGSLFFLLSSGMLLGSMLFGPFVDRYGYKTILMVAGVLIFIGLEGLAFADHLWHLRILMLVIGIGGSIINGATNALVSDISKDGRSGDLSLLGVSYGLGAFAIPLLFGGLSQTFGTAYLIAAVGLLVCLPLLFFISLHFPQPKANQALPFKQYIALAKEKPLLLAGAFLFFQSGLELTCGGWSATFIKEVLYIPADRAVIYLSLLMLAMVSTRLLLPRLFRKWRPAVILRTLICIALTGSTIMILSRTLALTLVGLVLLGVGLSAGFPVVLGYVGDRYNKLSGTAFGISFTLALIGSMILSSSSGLLGQAFGLRIAFILIPVSLIIQLIIIYFIQKKFQGA
jgi:MFS transporter, FHS family, glucose/mannose:H+ symporter